MTRPSLEEMNARQRRDGGEFKVYAWSEPIDQWLGISKRGSTWHLESWYADGKYRGATAWAAQDLIEKPVVVEWSMHRLLTVYTYPCPDDIVKTWATCHFRKENGVTKLVKVEVMEDNDERSDQ